MQFKKSLVSILGATVLAAASIGQVQAQAKPALTEIKVSYQPALYWALPFFVATEKGWWAELGLKPDEYQRIREILGRRPTSSELAMYSVMWSEHCSYKSSKVHLRQFGEKAPKTDALLVGIGENAGVVDIGQGYAVTFKIESHNHPSFIEPYQGAATGVGGIVRDILTMGAPPIS